VGGLVQETVKPERFGRYVLLDKIGSGGMAEVFRAVMPGAEGFRRTFVVKRILAELSQDATFVDMFVREARICSLLNHPSIVAVYDFGQIEGNYFLAMEYVRGRDLQAVVRKLRKDGRAFTPSIAAHVAREVAECLGYAHDLAGADGRSLNIIHRDVSPSNIMCLAAGGVKLLDFGIAKALGDTPEDRTEKGSFKGKLSYMAPERVRREPIDGRSDLFSLGVVLWEMLAGKRLFRAANDAGTLRNVLEATVPLPSSLRPEVPEALDAVVMRALERDPADRYASGQEMADDLEEVLRETKHQSKALPSLVRELFGASVATGQLGVAGLEEELAAVAESSTLRGTGTGTGSVSPLPGTPVAELSPSLSILPARWTWRQIAAATFAVSATMTLLVMLFGRGGGGHSHAMTMTPERAPPVTPGAGTTIVPAAPVANRPASTATQGAEPGSGPPGAVGAPQAAGAPPAASLNAATPEAIAGADAKPPAGAAQQTSGSETENAGKRSSRSRGRSDRDRIVRGLSIDPFADANRGRK